MSKIKHFKYRESGYVVDNGIVDGPVIRCIIYPDMDCKRMMALSNHKYSLEALKAQYKRNYRLAKETNFEYSVNPWPSFEEFLADGYVEIDHWYYCTCIFNYTIFEYTYDLVFTEKYFVAFCKSRYEVNKCLDDIKQRTIEKLNKKYESLYLL